MATHVDTSNLTERAINAIRALTIDATEAAGSGHPGMPMGSAAMAYVLWQQFLKHNPSNPQWFDRDRFVQSAGHGSMLLYSLLHLSGYDLPMAELERYRQWHSKTPGHPEYGHTPGVETTSGPLGQGISTAVGMALAEAHLAARFNRPEHTIVDHYTYVLASDGDLMEGVSAEACSLAGTLGLGKLIVLYDDNGISIDGSTDIAFQEDVLARYRAYGWHTQQLDEGNDLEAIAAAISNAQAERMHPSIIAVRTIIGYGAPNQGTAGVHGAPLGAEKGQAAKAALGIDWPAFSVPEDVLGHYRQALENGAAAEARWQQAWQAYSQAHPEAAATLQQMLAADITPLEPTLLQFSEGESIATRNASEKIINALAPQVPGLLGGSADLAGSNKTTIKNEAFMAQGDYAGRNIHFGVREHAMAAIGNGLSLHGGLRPYVATFLIFSDYLRPSLRLSALMKQPVVYVLTHDSIGLGGDGPTHQPVEHLCSLRAIPNVLVMRPAEGNETAQAWAYALEQRQSPVVLALSRQDLPNHIVPPGAVAKGAYIRAEAQGDLQLILIATGSEVATCVAAQAQLSQEGLGVRVVSMPCCELFDAQEASYRETILPAAVTARLAVEAASSLSWYKYTGSQGAVLGLDRFGESADGDEAMEKLGFSVANVVAQAKALLTRHGVS